MDPEANELNDFLTPEEQAALNESDFVDDGTEGADGAEAAAQAAAQAATPSEGDEPQQAAAEAEPAQAEPAQAPAEPSAQMPDVDMSALDQQLTDFKEKRNALLADYDDGEMTGAELAEKLDQLDTEADAVKSQKALAVDQIQRVEANWTDAVTSHLKAYPDLQANDQVLRAFDAAVRSVTGNPIYGNMSFDQQLTAAHELLAFQAKHAGLEGVPALKGAEPAPTPTPQPAAKAPQDPAMATPPVTLANVPASDISSHNDSPYAQLERLIENGDSDAIEAAYSKLTPEQRDEFSSMMVG